jgi:hypothetical protein
LRAYREDESMDLQVFLIEASHITFGAFATFCAILLWSRTRDLGWTFIIIATIVSYAGIAFTTFVRLGLVDESLFIFSGVPVVRLALTDLPMVFMAIGFLIVVARKRTP